MEYLVSELITLIAGAMPELSVVDEDYGQLENIDDDTADMYPLTFPAVLIETPETVWGDVADGAQKGTCTLRVRLLIDCYDDTHATGGTLDRAEGRNAMRHRLHALLQGCRPAGDGALMRTRSRFFTYNHGIKVYEATYTTTCTEAVTERATARRPSVAAYVGVRPRGNR